MVQDGHGKVWYKWRLFFSNENGSKIDDEKSSWIN